MCRDIETDSGTYKSNPVHPHNGYYAGDFSRTPGPARWSHGTDPASLSSAWNWRKADDRKTR